MGPGKPLGPYSIFKVAGDLVFVSGQLGVDSQGNIGKTIEEQTEFALRNIHKILASIGLSPRDIVKATIYTTYMNGFERINDVWERFFKEFGDNLPARSTVGIYSLPRGAKVEIEVIASISDPRKLFSIGRHFFLSSDFFSAREFFERAWLRNKKDVLSLGYAILSSALLGIQGGEIDASFLNKAFDTIERYIRLVKEKDKIRVFRYIKKEIKKYLSKKSGRVPRESILSLAKELVSKIS